MIWTVVPVLILVWIAVPSFRLLANQYEPPKAELTIKATGHQWYWEYEYPDQGGFSFDSIILSDADAAKHGDPAKLGVDNRVVVPVGATVRVLTTAADVIHAWAMPAFWVQMDAVPGRINETWFKVDRPGVYYGQCFQLCGTKHAFMPIAVEVVSQARFAQWVAAKQKENGITPKARRRRARTAPCRGAQRHRARRADALRRRRDRRSTADRPRRAGARRAGRDQVRARTMATSAFDAGLAHDDHAAPRRAELRPALAVLDQSQGHRHALPDLRDHRGDDRRRDLGHHARRTRASGHPVSDVVHAAATSTRRYHLWNVLDHRARADHGVLHGHAGDDRRLRQLVRAA